MVEFYSDIPQVKIDWSKPIEAVHENGRVTSIKFCDRTFSNFQGAYTIARLGEELENLMIGAFLKNGDASPYSPLKGWRIRNITPSTPLIPADIAERAMALVDRISNGDRGWWAIEAEARSILDELKPVDGDLVAAREIAADGAVGTLVKDILSGKCDSYSNVKAIRAAIAKGRSLERGGE